jgi:TatD family-associated radical SAM protein
MLEVARALKEKHRDIHLRLNTNGLGNLTAERDIVPELAEVFSTVSVSLNFPDERTYNERCRPAYPNAYPALLDFIRKCAASIPNVVASIPFPLLPDETEAAKKIAEELGARFRIR